MKKSSMKHSLLPYLLKQTDKPIKIDESWQNDGKEPLDFNKLLFFYKVIYNLLYSILDTIFTPFLKKPHTFVIPDSIFVNDYSIMLDFLYQIEEHPKFNKIIEADFTTFDPLSGDYESKLQSWKQKRGKFLDYKAQIDKLILMNAVKPYPIPPRLALFLKIANSNMKIQKQYHLKQSGITHVENAIPFLDDFRWDRENNYRYIFGVRGSYTFEKRKPKNNRQEIFKLIAAQRGETIEIKRIKKSLPPINDHEIYTSIGQLHKIMSKFGVSFICADTKARMIVHAVTP